jgi:hypothetical protein
LGVTVRKAPKRRSVKKRAAKPRSPFCCGKIIRVGTKAGYYNPKNNRVHDIHFTRNSHFYLHKRYGVLGSKLKEVVERYKTRDLAIKAFFKACKHQELRGYKRYSFTSGEKQFKKDLASITEKGSPLVKKKASYNISKRGNKVSLSVRGVKYRSQVEGGELQKNTFSVTLVPSKTPSGKKKGIKWSVPAWGTHAATRFAKQLQPYLKKGGYRLPANGKVKVRTYLTKAGVWHIQGVLFPAGKWAGTGDVAFTRRSDAKAVMGDLTALAVYIAARFAGEKILYRK